MTAHRMSPLAPSVKLVSAVALIIAASGYRLGQAWLQASVFMIILVVLYWGWLEHVHPLAIIKRAAIFTPFLLMTIIFGPGGAKLDARVAELAVKGLLSATVLAVLVETTPPTSLTAGMASLGVPSMLVNIISMMMRYLDVMSKEVRRMDRARRLRWFGHRPTGQFRIIGFMVANLFMRSYERGERVYTAMVLRGYQGSSQQSARNTKKSLGISRLPRSEVALLTMSMVPIITAGATTLWQHLN